MKLPFSTNGLSDRSFVEPNVVAPDALNCTTVVGPLTGIPAASQFAPVLHDPSVPIHV